jgi:hypothetical protein
MKETKGLNEEEEEESGMIRPPAIEAFYVRRQRFA